MKIHFIGIGGIGVSALANYYLKLGHKVIGSELNDSEITNSLKKRGAKIKIGPHKKENISKDVDLIIYSPAVKKNNIELTTAKNLKIKTLSYPEALGELTKEYYTIAVSGTHGKSTTTAMIGLVLIKAGFDPTIILGTKLKELGDLNSRVGKSNYLVIEADEHFASFLNYWPKVIVITNIEKDHLDFYKNLKNIKKAFKKFINHLPKDGILIINSKVKIKILNSKIKIKTYSLKQKEAFKLKKILKIPGIHNIENALAALNVARFLKIPDKITFKSLSRYKGSWRRFEERELKIQNRRVKIINDYAHHPTEIKVTLKAVKEKYPYKKIWCIFQPHQYQRTYYLFKNFVKVFKEAPLDKLIITDIYDVAGRENNFIKRKVSSQKLVSSIINSIKKNNSNSNKVKYIKNSDEIINYLKNNLKGGEVIVIMGAGDIYNLNINLFDIFQKKNKNKLIK